MFFKGKIVSMYALLFVTSWLLAAESVSSQQPVGIAALSALPKATEQLSTAGFSSQATLDNTTLYLVTANVTGYNDSAINDTLTRAGFSASLQVMIMTWKISSLRTLTRTLRETLITSQNILSILSTTLSLDDALYTERSIILPMQQMFALSRDEVIKILIQPETRDTDDNVKFLTAIAPRLDTIIRQLLSPRVDAAIMMEFGSEATLQTLSGQSREQWLALNVTAASAALRAFGEQAQSASQQFHMAYQNLFAAITNFLQWSFRSIMTSCNMNQAELFNNTLEGLAKRCNNLTLYFYIKSANLVNLKGLYDLITIGEYREFLSMTESAILDMNPRGLEAMVRPRVEFAQRAAMEPISALGFEGGIKITDIPSMSMSKFFSQTLKLTARLLRAVFQLSQEHLTSLQTMTFDSLVNFAKNQSVRATVEKVTTIRGIDLLMMLRMQEFTSFEKAVSTGMEWIGTRYTLWKITQIYMVPSHTIFLQTVPSFAHNHAGVSNVELSAAFKIDAQTEAALNRSNISTVRILNRLDLPKIYTMNLKDIAMLVLQTLGQESMLYLPLESAVMVSQLDFTRTDLDSVLKKLFMSDKLADVLSLFRIQGNVWQELSTSRFFKLASSLKIPEDQLRRRTLASILEDIEPIIYPTNDRLMLPLSMVGFTAQSMLDEKTVLEIAVNVSAMSMQSLLSHSMFTLLSTPLRNMLMNTTIASLRTMFYPLEVLLSPNFSVSSMIDSILIYDDVRYTQRTVVPILAGILKMEPAQIIAHLITPDPAPTPTNFAFLTALNPKLPTLLRTILMPSVDKAVAEYFGSDAKLLMASSQNATEFLTNNVEAALYTVRQDQSKQESAMAKITAAYNSLLLALNVTYKMTLMQIQTTCNLTDAQFWVSTFNSLSQRCAGIPSNYYIFSKNNTDVVGYYDNVTLVDHMQYMGLDIFVFKNQTMLELEERSFNFVREIEARAKIPISVLGHRSNILLNQLPNMTINDFLNQTLKAPQKMLRITFRLAEAHLLSIESTKFNQLPTIFNSFNVTAHQNKFFTLSAESLINLLAGREHSRFIKMFEEGILYIGTQITLTEVGQIYSVSEEELLMYTITRFSREHAGSTDAELGVALSIPEDQLKALGLVTISNLMMLHVIPRSILFSNQLRSLGELALRLRPTFNPDFMSLKDVLGRVNSNYENSSLSSIFDKLYVGDVLRRILLSATLNLEGVQWTNVFQGPLSNLESFLNSSKNALLESKFVDVLQQISVSISHGSVKLDAIFGFDKPVTDLHYFIQEAMDRATFFQVAVRTMATVESVIDLSLMRAGISSRLRAILKTTQIRDLRRVFTPFQEFAVLNKSLAAMFGVMQFYDTRDYTERFAVPYIAATLKQSTSATVAALIKPDSVANDENMRFLSIVLTDLKARLCDLIRNDISQAVTNYWGNETNLMRLSNVTEAQFRDLNCEFASLQLQGYLERSQQLLGMVTSIYGKLNSEITAFLNLKIASATSSCGIPVNDILLSSVANTVQRCLGVPISFYILTRNAQEVTAFYTDVSFEEYRVFFQMPIEAFVQLRFSEVEARVKSLVDAADSKAEMPVSLLAGDNGFKVSQLGMTNLADFVSKVISLNTKLARIALSISMSNWTFFMQNNFSALPTYVGQFGVVANQNQFYTITLKSLLSILQGQDLSNFNKFVDQGMEYLGTRLPLSKVLSIYELREEDGFANTIPKFALDHAGVDDRQLAISFGISLNFEYALKNITLNQARRINRLREDMFLTMNLKQIGNLCLQTVFSNPEIFAKLTSVLSQQGKQYNTSTLFETLRDAYSSNNTRLASVLMGFELTSTRYDIISLQIFSYFQGALSQTMESILDQKLVDLLTATAKAIEENKIPPELQRTYSQAGFLKPSDIQMARWSAIVKQGVQVSFDSLLVLLKRSGASDYSLNLLDNSTLGTAVEMFPGLAKSNTPASTIFEGGSNVILLDTPGYFSKYVEANIIAELKIDAVRIAEVLGISPTSISVTPFLSVILPKLKAALRMLYINETTMKLQQNGLTATFSNLTGITIEAYSNMRSDLFFFTIIGNEQGAETLKAEIGKIEAKLLEKVTGFMNRQLLAISGTCNVSQADILTSTIASLLIRCENENLVLFLESRKYMNAKIIFQDLTLDQLQNLLNSNQAAFMAMSPIGIADEAEKRIANIKVILSRPAQMPIFDAKVPQSVLENGSVVEVVSRALNVRIDVMRVVLEISQSDFMRLSMIMFSKLSALVPYSIDPKHFRILSFEHLYEFLMDVPQPMKKFETNFRADLGYLLRTPPLSRILQIFELQNQAAFDMDQLMLGKEIGGFTGTDIEAALDLATGASALLQGMKLSYTTYLTGTSEPELIQMTSAQIGAAAIQASMRYNALIVTVASLIPRAQLDLEYVNTRSVNELLNKVLAEASATPLYSTLKIEGRVRDILMRQPLPNLLPAVGMNNTLISAVKIIDVLIGLSKIVQQENLNKCNALGPFCSTNAVCNSERADITCICGSGFYGNGLDCFETVPQEFNISLLQLASSKGTQIVNSSSIIIEFSRISGISVERIKNITRGLEVSKELFEYIQNKSILALFGDFFGLTKVLGDYNVTMQSILNNMVMLERRETTVSKVMVVANYLHLSTEDIAQVLRLQTSVLYSYSFLTKANLVIGANIMDISQVATKKYLEEEGLSEDQFVFLAKTSVQDFTNLRGNIALHMMRENIEQANQMALQINIIRLRISENIKANIQITPTALLQQCKKLLLGYTNLEIREVFKECFQVSYETAAKTIGLGNAELIKVVGDLKVEAAFALSNVSVSLMDSVTFVTILSRSATAVGEILTRTNVPMSVSAYMSGVTFASLRTQGILSFVLLVTKLPENLFKSVFQVSESNINFMKTMTFDKLPAVVEAEIKISYSVEHFLTVSVQGLLKSLAASTKGQVLIEEFTKGVTYLSTQINLRTVQMVFGINEANLLAFTIPTLTMNFAGITPQQLRTALNFTSEQEDLFGRVKIGDAIIVTELHQNVFNMTVERIGHRIINLGQKGRLFFSAREIISQAKGDLNELNNVDLYVFVTASKYVNLNSDMFEEVLRSVNASVSYTNLIKTYPLRSFVESLDTNQTQVLDLQLFDILRRTREFFSSAVDKCAKFSCPVNSVCRNAPNSVACDCIANFIQRRHLCHEFPNQVFNQSLAVLAQANGVLLSYEVTVVALISQVTNISSTRVADIMQGLGASAKLVSYLNTTTVSQTIEQFYGINQVYNNFTVSAYNMSIMLVKLDSTQTTEVKLGILKAAVSTTEEAIAKIAKVTREELLNFNFLTEFNPRLPSIADEITMNSTLNLIANLGLTEQKFEATTKVNVTYLNHLRALSFLALIRENAALVRNLSMMVNGIIMRANATLQSSIALNISMVRMACAGSVSDFDNARFSLISSNCLGFDFSAIAAALNIRESERRELLARLSPTDMIDITNMSMAMFDANQVAQVIVLVDTRLRVVVNGFAVPISVHSSRAGITFAALPDYMVLNWARTVAQVSEATLLKIFNLQAATVDPVKAIKFSDLPAVVLANLGAVYSVNHFFTVSFQGLVRILLTEKTPAVAVEEFTRGATYLATQLQLQEVQAVYGVSRAHFLPLTLPGLSQTYAGITPNQLQMVLKFTKQQEEKFNRVSVEDAGIILNQTSAIFTMTLERIGDQIVKTGRETDVLYDSASGVLIKAGKSNLLQTATISATIVTHGQVELAAYQTMLAGLGASAAFSAMIEKYSQVSFAASLNLSVDTVSKTPLITILKTLKARSDQGLVNCSVFSACHENATCSVATGAVGCACKPGFIGNGLQCTDINECNNTVKPCDVQASCTNTIGSHLCQCLNGYAGNGQVCLDINECEASTHNCHANAACENINGSFSCACNAFFSGNGTNCFRGCDTVTCSGNRVCRGVKTGTTCICKNGFDFRSGSCQAASSVRIRNIRFNLDFKAAYGDPNTAEFQDFAAMLARDLLLAMNSSKVSAIQIISIRSGSVIVEYLIILIPQATLTVQEAEILAVSANQSPRMAQYNPDTSTSPSAQKSDVCSLNTHDCDGNARCVSNSDGSFKCECLDGYEKDGGKCEKKRNIAVIVVPVVIVGLILIFGITVLFMAYKKKRGESKLNEFGRPYSNFGNNAYEMEGNTNVYYKGVSEKE